MMILIVSVLKVGFCSFGCCGSESFSPLASYCEDQNDALSEKLSHHGESVFPCMGFSLLVQLVCKEHEEDTRRS